MDGTKTMRGIDAELYITDAHGDTLADNDEIDVVRGVETTNVWTEGDATVRQSEVQMTEPILAQISISFECPVIPDDTNYKLLNSIAIAKTKKYFHVYAGPRAEAGTQYVKAYFKVFDFSDGQPIDGLQTRRFVLKPCFQAAANAVRGIVSS